MLAVHPGQSASRGHGLQAAGNRLQVEMSDLELFNFDHSDLRDLCPGRRSLLSVEESSAPWTEARAETETSFSCREDQDDGDGDTVHVHLLDTSPETFRRSQGYQSDEEEEEEVMMMEQQEEEEEEEIPELFWLSDEDLSSGKTADYGFIIAVSCLVTGISLVAISYTVPRDVRVDPDSVSAREMERLEREKARVGAHLDRCVIAGLCLLTLGGVLLSTLLMISLWQGEMMRRKAFAYSKHAARLYGSVSLRTAEDSTCSHLSQEDLEDLEEVS
ncbi:transmembrane protein 74 [Cynoglossus semilaevis]|uniref:Transmembrane protein 74 n=1 Tax=Cynoglossus semilaevis TaxID=244447 RepID=A0A3P8VLE5_CYNSE|nr:transmembrane protein 74-like [Cynoglossus semilaevis]